MAEPALVDTSQDALDDHVACGPTHEVTHEVAALADTFVALMRTFGRARSRMLAAAAHDVEWSGHVVLKALQVEGPMRAGALAEFLLSDPSTVSRQVAALVKEDLIERRADPDDGRASILVLTPGAHDVLVEHDRIRLRYFADMLSDWDDAEMRTFSEQLVRFTDDFNRVKDSWLPSVPTMTASEEGTD